MLERLPNLILVTFVALLIWIFAEGQSVRQQTRDIDVALVMPLENRILSVQEPGWEGRAAITLEGSAANLDAALRELRGGIRLVAGEEFASSPGEFALSLLEAIRRSESVEGLGVTVAAVDPPELRVHIENLIERTAEVRAETPRGVLAGPPTVFPAEVMLRLPESLAATLPEPLEVVARLDAARLERLDRGRQQTVTGVRVRPPESLATARGVRAEPAEVNVTLTLLDTTRTVSLASVPVHVRVSAMAFNDWQVLVEDPFIRDVTIRGPGDAIDALPKTGSGELRIVATLPLSAEDLERAVLDGEGELTARVVFEQFPGPLSFEASDPTVRVRVMRRDAGTSP